jgi:hypothetical protein
MHAVQLRHSRVIHIAPVTLAISALASVGGLSFGLLQGWPIWGVGLAALIPWAPMFLRDVARIYYAYQWLALFYALLITQSGHFLEHVAQMVQIHVLGLSGADARGIFGALDIESVHFVWNSWVLLALMVLVWRFRQNGWLWLALALSTWHELEHTYLFWTYLTTGMSGTPGLLAQGGAIAGGLPISRPDLHFVYNLLETAPLAVAFFLQVRRVTARDRPPEQRREHIQPTAGIGARSKESQPGLGAE